MTLSLLIATLRRELREELPIRIHQRQPAVLRGKDGEDETFGHMTGLPFTAAFSRRIGHPDGYGYEFIAAASVDQEIPDWCRATHAPHRIEGQRLGLCARLVIAVVELRQPIVYVAALEDIDRWLAEHLLVQALEHAQEWRAGRKEVASKIDTEANQPPDSIEVVMDRHHRYFERDEAQWEQLRRFHPELPPFAVEWERRMLSHRRLGCPRCARVAA